MATAQERPRARGIDYPTGDGKPMAETDIHRTDMVDLIETLDWFFAGEPMVYVSGNLLVFYEEGNRRKHVSPDVFVVRGVAKKVRLNYLIWEEGKAPEAVIELTSKSTKREDKKKKWDLYRDVLKVREYFLFDPTEEYLKPPLQGYRLSEGLYVPIEWERGRLPSEVLGVHLERDGTALRLYDPTTESRLLTSKERAEAERERALAERRTAEAERKRADAERERADAERERAQNAEATLQQIAAEYERLRKQVDAGARPAD